MSGFEATNSNETYTPLVSLNTDAFPPAVPWAPAAVRLLKGVVYHDEAGGAWELIVAGLSPLTDYFARIGLLLIVDEEDGLAYLRQLDNEDLPDNYPSMPRLFHTIRLGFDASLLCVLLRERLREFEDQIHADGRCVISQQELLETWQTLVPTESDAVRLNKSLAANLRRLEELKFVKQFENEPPTWEVRRILKARLPLSQLELFRAEIEAELSRRSIEKNQGNDAAQADITTDE